MSNSATMAGATGRLLELAGRLREEAGFAEVLAALKAGHGATLGGVWGSSCASSRLLSGPIARRRWCSSRHGRRTLIHWLTIWPSSRPWPPSVSPPGNPKLGERSLDDEIYGERLRVLKRLAGRGLSPFSESAEKKGTVPLASSPASTACCSRCRRRSCWLGRRVCSTSATS